MAKALEGESKIDEHIQWNVETKARVQLWQAFTLGVGILVMVIGVVLLIVAGLVADSWRGWAWLLVGLVPCFLVPGWRLTHRQWHELKDPFGKTSPMERMVQPYIEQLLGAQEPGTVRVRVPYPVFINGGEVSVQEPPEEGDEPSEDLGDLIAFLELARIRGLARAGLVVKPLLKLPSGRRLTRPCYEAMIDAAIEWRIVERGGDGVPHTWRIEPDAGIELLERVHDKLTPPLAA
jgi:hypothetical protein